MAGANATRRRVPEDVAALILDGFRRWPGMHTKVARVAGVDSRTAARAWEVGLGYVFGGKPFKELVSLEQQLARAHLEKEAKTAVAAQMASAAGMPPPPPQPAIPSADDRENARNDAAAARAQEAMLVRIARGNVLGVLGSTTPLVAAIKKLAVRVKLELEKLADDPKAEVKPSELLALIRQIATTQRSAVLAAEGVITLERLLLGAPEGGDESDMTTEQAVKEIEEASDALGRARAAGLNVSVVQGGKQD